MSFKLIFLLSTSLLISACGGGGGSPASTSGGGDSPASTSGDGVGTSEPDTLPVLTGRFIDSPVEGLKYSTATHDGYTNSLGEFSYKSGEIVTFSVGSLEVGKATGSDIVTPLSLTGESDLNNISTKALNIARLLQTLDDDQSNKGVIKLPDSLRLLDLSNIAGINFSDFSSDSDLEIILNTATNLTSKSYALKDSALARDELKHYLTLVNTYNYITSGTTTGIDTQYYLLTMPSDGNFIVDTSNSAYLYDTNLNEVNYFNDNNRMDSGKSVLLPAGIYVVKVRYWQSIKTITINSPVL
jgi:hypothetical protein